jgi:hypothetical protein
MKAYSGSDGIAPRIRPRQYMEVSSQLHDPAALPIHPSIHPSIHLWGTNNSSASQEIPLILLHPIVHHRLHKRPPMDPILTCYFFNIHFAYYRLTPRSPMFLDKNFVCIFQLLLYVLHHLTILNLITLVIFGEQYKLYSSSLHNLLQHRATSLFLRSKYCSQSSWMYVHGNDLIQRGSQNGKWWRIIVGIRTEEYREGWTKWRQDTTEEFVFLGLLSYGLSLSRTSEHGNKEHTSTARWDWQLHLF